MCDPASIAVAATVASVASIGYSGAAQYEQHKYEAGIARNNAVLARNQAADAEERGSREELRRWQAIGQAKSAQLAGFAANGIDVTFGSPLDVLTDTAVVGAQDAWQIRDNAAREAGGYLISAQNYEQEAKAQRYAGRVGLMKTGLDMTSTVIAGASQVKGLQMRASPPGGGATPVSRSSSNPYGPY